MYTSKNSINFYDSLSPGSRPGNLVLRQCRETYDLEAGSYRIHSVRCQKQGNVDCAVYSIANVWCVLKGLDQSELRFTEKGLRLELMRSLVKGQVSFKFEKCKRRGDAMVYISKVF